MGCAGTAILQAPHVFDASLVEDGGQVGFGDVISKGAVTEHAGAVAGWGLRLVPGNNPLSQVFHLAAGYLLGQAGQQNATADAVHGFAGDLLLLDGDA